MKNNYCQLYIVRHGQSQANMNIERNISSPSFGELGSPLTELGEKQAAVRKESLQHVHFDKVFSSDLIRAKRTAEIIVQDRNLEVITTQIIRERDWGDESHKDFAALKKDIAQLQKGLSDQEKMKVTLPDIESEASAVSRLVIFLREIAVAYPEKTMLVVCHGTIMRCLLIHLGYGTYDEFESGAVKNTGYIVLESDGVEFFVKETHGIHKNL